jgi:hypothetical protein
VAGSRASWPPPFVTVSVARASGRNRLESGVLEEALVRSAKSSGFEDWTVAIACEGFDVQHTLRQRWDRRHRSTIADKFSKPLPQRFLGVLCRHSFKDALGTKNGCYSNGCDGEKKSTSSFCMIFVGHQKLAAAASSRRCQSPHETAVAPPSLRGCVGCVKNLSFYEDIGTKRSKHFV